MCDQWSDAIWSRVMHSNLSPDYNPARASRHPPEHQLVFDIVESRLNFDRNSVVIRSRFGRNPAAIRSELESDRIARSKCTVTFLPDCNLAWAPISARYRRITIEFWLDSSQNLVRSRSWSLHLLVLGIVGLRSWFDRTSSLVRPWSDSSPIAVKIRPQCGRQCRPRQHRRWPNFSRGPTGLRICPNYGQILAAVRSEGHRWLTRWVQASDRA